MTSFIQLNQYPVSSLIFCGGVLAFCLFLLIYPYSIQRSHRLYFTASAALFTATTGSMILLKSMRFF